MLVVCHNTLLLPWNTAAVSLFFVLYRTNTSVPYGSWLLQHGCHDMTHSNEPINQAQSRAAVFNGSVTSMTYALGRGVFSLLSEVRCVLCRTGIQLCCAVLRCARTVPFCTGTSTWTLTRTWTNNPSERSTRHVQRVIKVMMDKERISVRRKSEPFLPGWAFPIGAHLRCWFVMWWWIARVAPALRYKICVLEVAGEGLNRMNWMIAWDYLPR